MAKIKLLTDAIGANYKTVYADPPWNESGAGKIKRGADKHYDLMKTSAIRALPVSYLVAPNAHLYLWVTNNFLPDGLDVLRAWGFTFKTVITWAKDRIGIGQYFRGQTEQCLFGVRGVLPYKIKDGKRQQGSTLLTAPRTVHSAKPPEMIQLIERVSYAPRLEMFARGCEVDWDSWGNEL